MKEMGPTLSIEDMRGHSGTIVAQAQRQDSDFALAMRGRENEAEPISTPRLLYSHAAFASTVFVRTFRGAFSRPIPSFENMRGQCERLSRSK